MRMSQKRRERNELVEHVHHTGALRRAAKRDDLAPFIDPHNSPLRRYRVHDPKPVLIKQRIELGTQRRETPRLHLDELAIHTNEIDHEATNRYL